MTDDGVEDPAGADPADPREKEHQRRNRLQAELLRKVYERSRHAAFIDAALRRARADQETDETNRRTEGC